MPDGKRKRRFSINEAKRRWYAQWRSLRFFRRFGAVPMPIPSLSSMSSAAMAQVCVQLRSDESLLS